MLHYVAYGNNKDNLFAMNRFIRDFNANPNIKNDDNVTADEIVKRKTARKLDVEESEDEDEEETRKSMMRQFEESYEKIQAKVNRDSDEINRRYNDYLKLQKLERDLDETVNTLPIGTKMMLKEMFGEIDEGDTE